MYIMNRRQKVTYFISGILATIMLTALIVPVMAAAGKNITVYTGVNIYVDDVKLNPTDGNGNPVEAFIYNGTTYLPVRAVSEAVGKTVQWDGATGTVYLGKHTGDKPAVLVKDLETFTGSGFSTLSVDKDNAGNTYYNAATPYSKTNTYLLNGQYSRVSGTYYLRECGKNITNLPPQVLEFYGDGKLLYTVTMGNGIQPIDFDVDITGVLEFEVKLPVMYNTYQNNIGISEFGLWT